MQISDVMHYHNEAQSNNAFQPTPLRGPEIVGILEVGFVLTLVLIYTAARLNAGRSAAHINPN